MAAVSGLTRQSPHLSKRRWLPTSAKTKVCINATVTTFLKKLDLLASTLSFSLLSLHNTQWFLPVLEIWQCHLPVSMSLSQSISSLW